MPDRLWHKLAKLRLLSLLLPLLFLWMSPPGFVSAQESDSTPSPSATNQEERTTPDPAYPALAILYPTDGETLQGSLPINIAVNQPGINAWELSFAFIENPTDTWFSLARGSGPFEGEILRWDTTPLTDGDYVLRLRATFSDAYRDVLVTPLKIRNYSADTPTPAPDTTATRTPGPLASPTQLPTPANTTTPRQTPTPLPPNPVILNNEDIAESALRGAGYSLILFIAIGLLAWGKKKLLR
ncbi:MAG: hypothetical protein R6W69_16275 [Anaerolineales bacterium]